VYQAAAVGAPPQQSAFPPPSSRSISTELSPTTCARKHRTKLDHTRQQRTIRHGAVSLFPLSRQCIQLEKASCILSCSRHQCRLQRRPASAFHCASCCLRLFFCSKISCLAILKSCGTQAQTGGTDRINGSKRYIVVAVVYPLASVGVYGRGAVSDPSWLFPFAIYQVCAAGEGKRPRGAARPHSKKDTAEVPKVKAKVNEGV